MNKRWIKRDFLVGFDDCFPERLEIEMIFG